MSRPERLSFSQRVRFEFMWAVDPREAVDEAKDILFTRKEQEKIRETYLSRSPGLLVGTRDAILHPKRWFLENSTNEMFLLKKVEREICSRGYRWNSFSPR